MYLHMMSTIADRLSVTPSHKQLFRSFVKKGSDIYINKCQLQNSGNKEVKLLLFVLVKKINAILQLEFELGYCDIAYQHVSHGITGTPTTIN